MRISFASLGAVLTAVAVRERTQHSGSLSAVGDRLISRRLGSEAFVYERVLEL